MRISDWSSDVCSSDLALLAISLLLLQLVNTPAADGGPAKPLVYLLGNWAAPFGIVVIADRLSVLMLVLTSVLGFTAMLYALARWEIGRAPCREGVGPYV